MTTTEVEMLRDFFQRELDDLKANHAAAREESRDDHKQVKDSIQRVDDKVSDLRSRTIRLEVIVGAILTICTAGAVAAFGEAIRNLFF